MFYVFFVVLQAGIGSIRVYAVVADSATAARLSCVL